MHETMSTQAELTVAEPCLAAASDTASAAAPRSLGLAAALFTSWWTLREPLYDGDWPFLSIVLAGLGLVTLAGPRSRRGRLFAAKLALALGLLAVLVLATADRVLIALEARATVTGFFNRAIATTVDFAGYPTWADGKSLHVLHHDGLVTILPSAEKVGLRPLCELWLVWVALAVATGRRRLYEYVLTGGVAVLLTATLHFLVCLFFYLESDDILVGSKGLAALSVFSGALGRAATLIAAGVALDLAERSLFAGDTRQPPIPAGRLWRARTFLPLLAAGVLVGFAGWFDPPGKARAGRILFDDRFCGTWEPTARLLDTQWYGDFATYSFSSLTEWLGHWYVVDVNAGQPYTDRLLKEYDVLVLKTPVKPIPEDERRAIDRFVNAGGGLLLIGDHTNLLGMNTHINSLCARYGIRFRYDSVSGARTGGFVNYYGPSVGRNVGAIHVDHLEFMTSCSLEVDWRAEPTIVATSCRRDPHDYAGSSFFGRIGPHPEMAHGPTVLAASVRAGRGRIAAFTDSTVWSSFAVFQFDREKLAADLIFLLNHEPSPWSGTLILAALGALGAAIFGCTRAVRDGAATSALIGTLIGVWAGIFAADQVHERVYDHGPPREPISEVAFLWRGGLCFFPPVLGSTGSLPLDRAYDTLLVSTQRLGLVPRIVESADADELIHANTRVIFVIAPVHLPPEKTLARIRSFVKAGGSLIVLDDSRLLGKGSAARILRSFGIFLRYRRSARSDGTFAVDGVPIGLENIGGDQAPDSFVAHRAYGAGHVVFMRDAVQFSRDGLGHCFNRPGKVARARYELVYRVFRDILHQDVRDRRSYGIYE